MVSYYTGDWSNGMIGVSKTFGGSSILSSPAVKSLENCVKSMLSRLYLFADKIQSKPNLTENKDDKQQNKKYCCFFSVVLLPGSRLPVLFSSILFILFF